MDGGLVRHEMLHALRSELGHPRDMFLERCGGLVVCLTSCVRDGGAPPDYGAAVARILPAAMLVDVEVDPAQPGVGRDGHFRVIVTATNPVLTPVQQLPSTGDTPLLNHFTRGEVRCGSPNCVVPALRSSVRARRGDGFSTSGCDIFDALAGFRPDVPERRFRPGVEPHGHSFSAVAPGSFGLGSDWRSDP
jgi:hypothetical protein